MRDITAGRKITAIAMTEPDAGSDLASMRSTARKTSGGYLINGAKMFITNGVHADIVFVAAKTGEAGRGRHMTMFAVESGTPGFRVARILKKQGWLSSDTAELTFEDCFVPDANVLGEEGRGFYQLVKNLQNERIVLAAQALGEAMKALEITLDWVKQRKAFGAPLWDKQTIRQRLSMRLGQVEAARALLVQYRLARYPQRERRQGSVDAQGARRHACQRSDVRLSAIPRRHGLHAGTGHRAHEPRRARAVDRRRRHRGDAGRGRQKNLIAAPAPRAMRAIGEACGGDGREG